MKNEHAADAAIINENKSVDSEESTDGPSDLEKIQEEVKKGIAIETKKLKRKRKVSLNKRLRGFIKLVCGGEAEDAKWLSHRFMGKVLHDHSDKSWYEWTGQNWTLDKIGGAYELLKELKKFLAEEYAATATEPIPSRICTREQLKKAFKAKLKRLEELNYGKRVLEYSAQGRGSLGIDGSQWDENPNLLGFKNGVLDLDTLEFRDGRPDDYIREIIPHNWAGIEAQAPIWENFMHSCLPEDPQDPSKGGARDVIHYVQKLFGVALSGKAKERMLPVLIGDGQNGKGTMIEFLGYAFETLSCPVDSEMLMEQSFTRSSSAPSADKMALRWKRFIWASETNEGRKLDSGKVKALTGGDTITARAPYGKYQVKFQPTHQLFLITNHAPIMDPDDRALWYRVSFIHFPLSFVERPQAIYERPRDKDLLQKLKAETSGVIAWVVRGYRAYLEEGLQIPRSVQATTSAYRDANDHIGQFTYDCLEKNERERVLFKNAYSAYVKWAEESKLKPMARPLFKQKMAAKIGESKRESAGNFYKGYKLIKAG